MVEWASNDLGKEFLMPNQKGEGNEEGLNWYEKMEWTMMLKLWGEGTGKT
jgi:hypothetical protein